MQHFRIDIFVAVLISFILGSVSLWQLHEDDIYWLLRAGDDILKTSSISNTETWSFTIPGENWVNYHWLSQVVLRILYEVHTEAGLVFFRGFAIALLFIWVNLIICYSTQKNSLPYSTSIILMFLLSPMIYISMIFRFHLRPDFFCLLTFAYFIYRGTKNNITSTEKFHPPIWWLTCLFLSSQWHAGAAVYLGYVIAILTFFQIFSEQKHIKNQQCWIQLIVCATLVAGSYFANPSHFKMLHLLWVHAQYDQSLITNTEYLSFHFNFLNTSTHGWPFIMWFIYLALGWISFLYLKIIKKKSQNIYQNIYAVFIIGVTLSLLSIQYIRMIPFHLVYFLPIITDAFLHISSKKTSIKYIYIVCVLFTWAIPLQSEVYRYKHLWGFKVNKQHFPVREVEFIKKTKPLGNIFSDFLPGSYQTWALREYPVFADHRDVIYNKIKPLLVGFQSTPTITRLIEDKFNINTAMVPILKNQWDSKGNIIHGLNAILPTQSWSLVFFSQKLAILIKRKNEHQNIIDEYEYHYLNPADPLQVPFLKIRNQPMLEKKLEHEIQRCLIDSPENTYCTAIQSELFIQRGQYTEAISILEKSRDFHQKKDTNILIQLWKAYTQSGNKEKAHIIDEILQNHFKKQ
ncbi:MAG: hypothetical protein AB8C84_07500 [Oligoflexales bacterium]